MAEPTANRPDDQAPLVLAHGCPAGTDHDREVPEHNPEPQQRQNWLNELRECSRVRFFPRAGVRTVAACSL